MISGAAGACPSEEDLLVHLASPGAHVDSEKLLAHFDECAACRLAMAIEPKRPLSFHVNIPRRQA